jgi:ParB family transcriptional regulator, chromosome partitioning protein
MVADAVAIGGEGSAVSKSEGYLTDPALLDRLANEKLEREAEAVRQEGSKWIEITPDPDGLDLDGFGEVRGNAQPLPPKQAKALAKAEREADKLRTRDELDDDEAERLDVLDAEIAALSEHSYTWSDRQKARAGAIVNIAHDGKLAVIRGLLRPEDVKPAKPDGGEASGETEQAMRPAFSAALADDLTAHRTAALRAMLADRPTVALAATAHALALPVFYAGGDSALALHVVTPALRAEGIGDSPAAKSLADQHAAWQSRLPDDQGALWDWLLTQEATALTGLLAYCVASTVKPEGSVANFAVRPP